MMRMSLIAGVAASLLFAGGALAETKPPEKPGTPPKQAQPTPPKPDKTAKPETKPDPKKAAAKAKRMTYACDGGVNLTVTYPPEAQAKTGRLKIAMKDTTYFLRPVAGTPGKFENKAIKLVFQTKGDEATLEREGKPLAEKCKSGKPST